MTKAKPGRALKEVFRNLFKKPATRPYPAQKAQLQRAFRGQIKFDPTKCIGCKMCMRDCPAKAITIEPVEVEKYNFAYKSALTGQNTPVAIAQFGKRLFSCTMDVGRCIYCAQCVDTCPKKALHSSQDFELAVTDRSTLKHKYMPETEGK